MRPTPASQNISTRRPDLPREGEILDRKYRIEQPLGAGAMGVVLAARHLHLDERVAIKLLRSDYAESEEFTARFLQEGRAMIKIRSEHVVRVLDVGMLEGAERTPYLVMEHLEGNDLDSLLAAHATFPVEQAIDLILQGIEAIAEAHALGIVHRDLKPGNLFLTLRRDGSPCLKVLDFGISMFDRTAPGEERITQATAVMGSPAYMSPEQMRSTRDVDARTDVWALGVILYEMLTGAAPFNGRTGPEVCANVLEAWPRSMRELVPTLDPALEQAIHRCLEKDKERRYANVAELARALAPFGTEAAGRSAEIAARVLRLQSIPPSTPPLLTQPSRVAQPSQPSRKGPSSLPPSSAWGRDATLVSGRPPAPPRMGRRRATLGAAMLGVAALAGAILVPLAGSGSEVKASANVSAPTFVKLEPRRDAGPTRVEPAATAAPSVEVEMVKVPRTRVRLATPPTTPRVTRSPTHDVDPAEGLFDERK